MKTLKCDDVMHNGCTFEAHGESEDEVVGKLKEHGMQAHADAIAGGDEAEMEQSMRAAVMDSEGGDSMGGDESPMM